MTSTPAKSGAETTRRAVLAAGAGVAVAGLGLTEAKAQATEIIDIHAHIISDDPKRYPPSPFGGNESDWARTRPESFDQLITQMDSAGVSKAALVQVSTYYGSNDTYLADSIARFPKRFTGVCSIDTLAPDNVAVLQGWLKRGMTGLRIFTGGTDTALLVNPKAFPIWEFAQTSGLPICVETSVPGLTNTAFLLKRYPKVKVILDHCAHPILDDGAPFAKAQSLFELAAFSNLYLKITPRTFEWSRTGKSTPDAFFGKLASTFGADHMAFGSNIPSDAPPMTKLVADAHVCLASLSAKDRAMVLAETAKRLYPSLA